MSYLLPVVDKLDIGDIEGGANSGLVTSKGEMIDLFCDNGVVSLGYNYAPKEMPPHLPSGYKSEFRELVAEKICKESNMDYAFFSTSGTESVEAMMKFGRKFQKEKGRKDIYFMEGSFHGRTYGTMSADFTGKEYHLSGYRPFLPGVKKFKNISDIDKNAALVIITPADVYGDFKKYDNDFIDTLQRYCDENDILLGIDEVQTYLRTGNLWGFQMYDGKIEPDMVATAKGVAGGIPTGLTLIKKRIGNSISKGGHFSTFGGNMKSCLGVHDTIMNAKALIENANEMGSKLKEGLKELDCKNIRGEGLIIAFDYDEPMALRDRCLKNNLILGVFSNNQPIKMTPPLTIQEETIERILEVFNSCL